MFCTGVAKTLRGAQEELKENLFHSWVPKRQKEVLQSKLIGCKSNERKNTVTGSLAELNAMSRGEKSLGIITVPENSSLVSCSKRGTCSATRVNADTRQVRAAS
jgi:hypothetical protein